jgi:hypothetical protein
MRLSRDREALTRALEMARAESKQERAHFDALLSRQGWEEAALSACFVCQSRTLKLRPWQAPPVHVHDDEVTGPSYGHRPEEIALRRRMLAAGLSVYEPDPIAALEAAESARHDERVVDGKRDRAQPPSSQPEPQ